MSEVYSDSFKGTTICAVKRDGKIAVAGDGQVTAGESVIIYDGKVVIGFAGTVADAFTLEEKFEEMLQKFSGNLLRSAVEVAQLWRRDNVMRKLEAMMIVCDKQSLYILSGTGDVIEPDDGVCAIGSGGNYALSAAKALLRNTDLSAAEIARKSLEIASELCVYTNDHITVEEA